MWNGPGDRGARVARDGTSLLRTLSISVCGVRQLRVSLSGGLQKHSQAARHLRPGTLQRVHAAVYACPNATHLQWSPRHGQGPGAMRGIARAPQLSTIHATQSSVLRDEYRTPQRGVVEVV